MSSSDSKTELDLLRRDILGFFPTVLALLDAEEARTRHRVLGESRERLASEQFFVVVCGEFRRGKSSLLNALVRRRRLFPVDVDVTTAVVSTLRWGPAERAVVWPLSDPERPGERPEPFEVPLSEVHQYVTEQGNPRNVREVERIEMEAPFAPLKSGLVLVDTPGVGSINPAHTAATRAFLPRADAVLFVGSAVQPLTTVELDFVRHALETCPVIVTAVTMVDKVVDATPVVAQARARIAQVSELPPDDLVVVGVSAFRRWEAVEDEDPTLEADSGFPELEAALWGGLADTCGRAALYIALDQLDEALDEIAAPLTNEAAALQSGEALAAVEKEIQRTQDTLTALRSGGSRWRRDLQDDLEQAARPIRKRLGAAVDSARDAFQRGCEREQAAKDPEPLVRKATLALLEAAEDAHKALETAVTEVAERYSRITSVPLTTQVAAPSTTLPDTSLSDLDADQDGMSGVRSWRRARSVWNSSETGGGMGMLAGAVVGSVVPVVGTYLGAFIGGVIGHIAGWFGGSKQAQAEEEDRRDRQRVARLKERVIRMLESGRRQVEQDFNGQLRDCNRTLVNLLEDQLSAQTDALSETVRRLQETRRSTAKERTDRLPVVRRKLTELQTLRLHSRDLRLRVETLGGAGGTGGRSGSTGGAGVPTAPTGSTGPAAPEDPESG
ncbi:dynamin family protein [Streptomyces sp. NPDC046909]|uniref:dynamin family protein n=1 Tax=Streptomyces sp. NPDC046909 TaxID=3155617 RepID=UPI00340AAFE2